MIHMLKMGEIHDENGAATVQNSGQESVSQIFKHQLIVRAPDKMIDYFCDFILIAYRNLIVAINVTDLKIDGAGAVESSDKVIETAIEEGSITYLDLQNSYKIIAM